MSLIKCTDLCINYGNNRALQNIDLHIDRGDYLCIIGENGSGKSSLLKGVLGLAPVNKGSICFSEGQMQNEIGYLPQQTEIQKDFPASVKEVVLSGFAGRLGKNLFYTKEQKGKAIHNIDFLGIKEIANKPYRSLSGGQQQRVLLARALCAASNLLFLDEPTAGLDPNISANFYSLLKKLNTEDGFTIVMTSHDIANALSSATKILHLDTNVVFFGSKEDYVSLNIVSKLNGGDANA